MCGKSGNIRVEWTTNTAGEVSGISRWAVATLTGMLLTCFEKKIKKIPPACDLFPASRTKLL